MKMKAIGIVLIFIASGVWLHLDCLNRQELGGIEHLHQEVEVVHAESRKRVERARAEARKLVEVKENFENQILIDLTNCQVAAEKTKTDFTTLIEKAVSNKPDRSAIPQIIGDEVKKIHIAAYAECQRIYNDRVKVGF